MKVLAHHGIKRDVGGPAIGRRRQRRRSAPPSTPSPPSRSRSAKSAGAQKAGGFGARLPRRGAGRWVVLDAPLDWRKRPVAYTIGNMATKKPVPEGPVEVPDVISILPLRNSVLFPGSIIPIDVGGARSR